MTTLETLALAAAAMHVPLALTVWSLLFRRWPRRPLALWVSGSLATGIGATLAVVHDGVPAWASGELANALMSASAALRIAALRVDLRRPPLQGLIAGAVALDFGLYLLSVRTFDELGVMLLGFSSFTLWTLALAWHGALIGRAWRSRAGWTLAGVEAVFAATLLLRAATMLTGQSAAAPVSDTWDFGLLVAAGFLSALYGNLAYLGLVLDRTNADMLAAREARLVETVRRETAEARTAEMQQLLHQRDGLARERQRLLHLLAHELRQPLHTANGALDAASRSLRQPDAAGTGLALEQLEGAHDVLIGMRSVLDNTLAVAKLLDRQAPLLRLEVEIDLLIGLTLGDLPPAQRRRVQVLLHTDGRMVLCEPGLVRLALRNLLRNALGHGGPAAAVTLHVEEQDDPPTIWLAVADDGPGAPPEVLRWAASAPAEWPGRDGRPDDGPAPGATPGATSGATPGAIPATPPTTEDGALAGASGAAIAVDDPGRISEARGMGLQVVRQVAALHGGELELRPCRPSGLLARFGLPQTDADW